MTVSFLKSCCRVCLAQNPTMIYIYDKVEQFDMILCELLQICGDIQIDQDDKCSKLICEDCTTELLMVAKFRQKCKTSASALCQLRETLSEEEMKELQEGPGQENVQVDDYLSDGGNNNGGSVINNVENETITEDAADYIVKAETTDLAEDLADQCIEPNDEIYEATNNIEAYDEIEYLEVQSTASVANQQTAVAPTTTTEPTTILPDVDPSKHIVEYFLMDKSGNFDEIIEECDEDSEEFDEVEEVEDIELEKRAVEPDEGMVEEDDNVTFDDNVSEKNLEYVVTLPSLKTVINYKCEFCGAGFMHVSNLNKHLKTHKFTAKQCVTSTTTPTTSTSKAKRTKLPKQHKCIYCEKAFVSNSLLVAHVRVHTGEKPFKCNECNKSFSTQGGLDLHTKRHIGLKPFACQFCDRRFVESSNLKVHLRTHTGEKPHECNRCDKSFSRVFLLQIHLRTHTRERPYLCEICNKSFSQQGDLAAHRRIHTGERPHKCKVCAKGFIKSSALTSHMRRHDHNNVVSSNTNEAEEIYEFNASSSVGAYDDDIIEDEGIIEPYTESDHNSYSDGVIIR